MSNKLNTKFCGVYFKNPIVVASTDIGRTAEGFERFAKTGVGGIITKSVTDAAPLQNKGITMFDVRNMDETPVGSGTGVPDDYYFFSRGGAMISMDAYEATALQILSIARQYEVIPIASICASKLENWVTYARRFEEMGYPMLELNLGNPHGEAAKDKLGFKISQETQLCVEIASTVTHAVKIPVVVKLTPQVADLSALTQALEASGVQAVTIMHRYQGLVIDHKTLEPVIGGYAAIGGPWMKPLSLANVAKVRSATNLSIMGGNGVDTAQDVLDFLLAGADLVQVGSSMMLKGPSYAARLVQALETAVAATGRSVGDLTGLVAEKIIPYTALAKIAARRAVIDTAVCHSCQEKPCLERCCYQALSLADGTLTHNNDSCSGCGMCKTVCPKGAVRIEKI